MLLSSSFYSGILIMRVSTLKLGYNMAFEREKTEEHYLEILRTKYRVIPAEKYPDGYDQNVFRPGSFKICW